MEEKVVNCYFMPLPRLSYTYWLIHFNISQYSVCDYFIFFFEYQKISNIFNCVIIFFFESSKIYFIFDYVIFFFLSFWNPKLYVVKKIISLRNLKLS